MLRIALLSSNADKIKEIEYLLQDSEIFKLIHSGSPDIASGIVGRIRSYDPELILVDLQDWPLVGRWSKELPRQARRGVIIGFRHNCSREERLIFEDSGILDILPDPFSVSELEAAAYEGLHRVPAAAGSNILIFLPAKAGGGCSTVTLNTAAALASVGKKVVLLECDRRSGVLSILLNVENRLSLADALAAEELTPVLWQQHITEESGVHLLLANPARRGPLLSWIHYYRLLSFLQGRYDFILGDLPEVINEATAELVRSARDVFIVCEPEVPSLKLGTLRCGELETCGISAEKVHIIVNRWDRTRYSIAELEQVLGRSVFATLANDYKQVHHATVQARVVSENSKFAESCRLLAEKLNGTNGIHQEQSKFTLLRKLGRLAT